MPWFRGVFLKQNIYILIQIGIKFKTLIDTWSSAK